MGSPLGQIGSTELHHKAHGSRNLGLGREGIAMDPGAVAKFQFHGPGDLPLSSRYSPWTGPAPFIQLTGPAELGTTVLN